MRLRRGLRVLPRGPGEVQIGTDPRWAVRVTDLTNDEATALVSLPSDSPLGGLAADDRLSPERLAALLTELDQARLLDPAGARTLAGPRQADAAVLGLSLPDGDGAAVVDARAHRSVGIVGLGPTGLGLAAVLASAGVGTLRLEDRRPVRSTDIGPSGYRWPDVGAPRAQAAARVVAGLAPEVAVDTAGESAGSPTAPRVDLLVVVAEGALDPVLAAGLLSTGTTHLVVVLREGDTVVGPLVVPGDGPCGRCLDLHRSDLDPHWTTVAAALARDTSTPPAEPHAVAAVAAGIAGAAVLATLDAGTDRGPTPTRRHRPLRGATLEIGLPDVRPVERQWAAHPSCGCAALGGPDRAPTGPTS